MKSEVYYVLMSEDGLFYVSHQDGKGIQLTHSPVLARTWDWKEDANAYNVEELLSHLRLGQITLTIERLA